MACDVVYQDVMYVFPVLWPDGSNTRRLVRVSTQSLYCTFLGFDVSPWSVSSISVPQGSRRVKNNVCRPSQLSFLPKMSPASKIDFKLNEHPG